MISDDNDNQDSHRASYRRALDLIDALELQTGGHAVVHGLLKAWMIATANDVDRAAERHRGNPD